MSRSAHNKKNTQTTFPIPFKNAVKKKKEKKKKSNFKAFCVTRKCKNNKNSYCKAFCVTRKHAINSQLALNCFSDERLD